MQTPDESLTYRAQHRKLTDIRQIQTGDAIQFPTKTRHSRPVGDIATAGASAILSQAPENEDEAVIVEIKGPDDTQVLVRVFCGVHAAGGRT